MDYRKIKFEVLDGNAVAGFESPKGESVTIDEIIRILRNPNVIKITAKRMTPREALKRVK